jgi:uncharacterized protein YcaQ
MKEELSLAEARRIALTAQGFNGLSREGSVGGRQIKKTIDQLALLQIDSVNVLVRAHYVPIFSRLGAYDVAVFDNIFAKKPRSYFEYWGHEASLLPIELHPYLRWRMADAYKGKGIWRQLEAYAGEKRPAADALLERIRVEGPLAASDIAGSKAQKGMWVWSDAKHALEWLFWSGLITSTHRRTNFERVYDLPERVLPLSVLNLPTPDPVDARRLLLARAAQALGVATAGDLRDYFRISSPDAALPMQQLIEEGTVIPARVQGWKQQAYLYKHAIAGRKIEGSALLSPFDPLIWHRSRTERLFNFYYRLEIYTPVDKRQHGYYVLPFLMNGSIVARVDLKADRKKSLLVVLHIHRESNAPKDTMERLKEELMLTAKWLGLLNVAFSSRRD